MAEWRPWIDAFLSESLRLHGRGYDPTSCDTCGVECKEATEVERKEATEDNDSAMDTVEAPSVGELYRCRSCGSFSECVECCLKRHQRTPLHKVEVCALYYSLSDC